MVTLRGEVHFPNIEFEKSNVDFGCILNDTEVTRYVNITNCSPMDVKYHWSFLIDDDAVTVFQKPELPGHLHHLVTDEMMDNAALAADVEETIQADLDAEVALPPGWSPSSIHKVCSSFLCVSLSPSVPHFFCLSTPIVSHDVSQPDHCALVKSVCFMTHEPGQIEVTCRLVLQS